MIVMTSTILVLIVLQTWHSWLSRPQSTWPLYLVLLEEDVKLLYKATAELLLCQLPYKADLHFSIMM